MDKTTWTNRYISQHQSDQTTKSCSWICMFVSFCYFRWWRSQPRLLSAFLRCERKEHKIWFCWNSYNSSATLKTAARNQKHTVCFLWFPNLMFEPIMRKMLQRTAGTIPPTQSFQIDNVVNGLYFWMMSTQIICKSQPGFCDPFNHDTALARAEGHRCIWHAGESPLCESHQLAMLLPELHYAATRYSWTLRWTTVAQALACGCWSCVTCVSVNSECWIACYMNSQTESGAQTVSGRWFQDIFFLMFNQIVSPWWER